MVRRPGSTTPEKEKEVVIKQEPEAGASSVARSPTTSEHGEGPAASWSSEGTFTIGHVASDDLEGNEVLLPFPMWLPPRKHTGLELRRSPSGLKPAKAEDQQPPTTWAAEKPKTQEEEEAARARLGG
ncbi:hypothetical protein ON010_g15318 [Phytophthora cinnamomi]|nr:hypothetical protein ON010_g15318 [Phytophthora cinnamomi]